MIFRRFILWGFELCLAVVLDFRDEVEEHFQINLDFLDACVKTGGVLTDGISAPREIPGTSSRRTRRISRTYTDFISKKVDISEPSTQEFSNFQSTCTRMMLTYASTDHENIFVILANIIRIFRLRDNRSFRLFPAVKLLNMICISLLLDLNLGDILIREL